MKKPEDNPDMKVLKTATCNTLSGNSKLTYQVGTLDDEIHIRISKNTGGGFFSQEFVSLNDIKAIMEEHPEGTPLTAFILQPLFHGKSVNTPAFLLAALAHEKLLRPMKGKKRSHEPVDPEEFTSKVEKMTSSNVKPKGAVKKTTKRVAKKAPRKKATGRINKASTTG
jgi:hypothetical protein